jgi:hypothetical protein
MNLNEALQRGKLKETLVIECRVAKCAAHVG